MNREGDGPVVPIPLPTMPLATQTRNCPVSPSSRRDRLEGGPQIINAAMMGGRSCEAPLAPFRVGGPCQRGPRDAMYSPDVFTHNICPEGGHSFLHGRRFHVLTPSTFSLVYCSRPQAPGPHFPPCGSSLRSSRVPASLRFSGNPLGSRRRSFRKPGQAGGINPGRQGRGYCGHGHESMGAARCVRQPFFLPRGAAKGAELDTCG